MKLPIAWLKKYIDVTIKADDLADKLTLSGSKVECVENIGGEPVIDIEVTTNRPDCLSILGLAYEVSAITGKKVIAPAAYRGAGKISKNKTDKIAISIQDKKACPRYTARIIENISVKSSPIEVQKFMSYMGARAVSNIVDATNYVLFECGQPLHAFDLDKIKGTQIIIRLSKNGEKFQGIDGIEYTLDDKTLVIADAERTIAIAGVMGGKLTEVTHDTKNILLESAYFDLALVRQAAKKYKITTESSYRFERGVNPAFVSLASQRAADLIIEWGGGSDTGLIDKNHMPSEKKLDITLRLDRMESLLGVKISGSRASQILKSLSLTVKPVGKDKLKVSRTSSRRDLAQEADLIEEVLRIDGFDKIPVKLPQSRHGLVDLRNRKALRTRELKKWMAALGFQEIMSYSLLSEKVLQNTSISADSCHKVANAVSAEQAFFRPSLMPGLLQSILFNASRKATGLRLFEIGNVYEKDQERTVLSFALYGMWEENWRRKNEASLYEAKGVLENVLEYIGESSAAAKIESVPQQVLKKWDISHPVYFCELTLDTILKDKPKTTRIKPVPKYPSVKRDIAVVLESSHTVQDLTDAMQQAAAPHLRSVTLFDEFMGKGIPQGKRSLAFSLNYQKDDGTFTDPEIQKLQDQVGEVLKSRFHAEFR